MLQTLPSSVFTGILDLALESQFSPHGYLLVEVMEDDHLMII